MAKDGLLATSLRWRVVAWTTVVVLVALTAVLILTRSFYMGQITDNANAAVVQEIDEFTQFAQEGIDPDTGEGFNDPQRLIEVYIQRQIPDSRENMVGFVDGRMAQIDFSKISGTHPEPVKYDDPIVHEILNSPSPGGRHKDIHWGRVEIDQNAIFAVLFNSGYERDQADNNMIWISLISLGGLLAAMLMAWLVSGQITAPIRKLQKVASSISNSDLTTRVPIQTNDEIGQLAHTFNAMLDRLEMAYRDQRQFIDDAGHELRTPITVVRGQLELLPSTPPEQRQKSIDLATAELDRMARMVNDMLTLAVADSGDFIKPEMTDLTELTITIDDKASSIDPRARLVDVAEGETELDPDRVTEAVLELFGNALKYSQDEVEIGSTLHGEGPDRIVRFWVRDRGEGIAEDKRDQLFSRFSRGDTLGSRPEGAGLGLSIVKAIGEAHGGKAYVESTVGLGSIFGLEIPAPEHLPAQK
ncbi:sensor histidine kinase [Corynebacterium cystitidis]|uniref:sensor histidine kinase n=1 Tax=Corynebacterium cystitidis TaxID=35757 RepID=UPI00211F4335|nr:HAMP domain-containing sensor histidine kinase [Corynebacterium cystitidis]